MLRKSIIALAMALCFIVCGVIGIILMKQENRLETLQKQAIELLDAYEGEYDTSKIVLNDTTREEAEALAKRFNAKLRITKDGSFATLTLPNGVTLYDIYSNDEHRDVLDRTSPDFYASTSEVSEETEEEIISERLPSRPQYTVSDVDYDKQTYLDYLNIGEAWNVTKGSGITVAVIDTGIDTDHPEFAGKISEYSYNATEDKVVKDYTLENGSYDWSLIEDEQGHGTSVSGVIAASMDGNGIVGVASDVTLLIIKAECDENGQFTNTSDLVFGLYYAIERDVDVVNMSFGAYTPTNPFADATKLAVDSDITCVAAAGNDATTQLAWPAADENVIGVGALADNSWELAYYSNYGDNSDIVAPGTTYTTAMGGGYKTTSGTSLASPVVAGGIALYLSRNGYSTFDKVVENLYASSYDLGSLGNDWSFGYGALDINALVCEERGKVTFDMLTDEVEDIEQVFVRNHTLQNLPEPERTYAVFDGWYYDIHCTEELNWYEDVFTSDLTLYASWVNEDDGIPYTYVTLPDDTIEIRSYTGKRRYITIPETIDGKPVTSIGDFAFEGQSRLRQINLPTGLKHIGLNAFYDCHNLTEISIPEGVTSIGANAFYNNVRLSSVIFSNNAKLTSVGDFAFAHTGLSRFELPASLISVNGSAFYGSTGLKAITVQEGNTAFRSENGVLFDTTGNTLVAYPAGLNKTYAVPASVQTVGYYAFAYAKLKSVDLSSVTSIGGAAFEFAALESVTIPNSVISLGQSAFAYNFNLRTVTLGTGLSAIPQGCFTYAPITHITIPSNVQSIGMAAFADTSLNTVTFEENSKLIEIGSTAFYGLNLKTVVFPDSLTYIGEEAFAWNFGLTSITFGENSSLQIIDKKAFVCDTALTSVALPKNLRQIGDYAFLNTRLETVALPASLTMLGEGAFAACHSLESITVEEGNTVYKDLDGVVYSIDGTSIVAYPAGNVATSYAITDTVTTVGAAAFYGAYNLTNVTLPVGLQTVAQYAFYDCKNMSGYTFPESLTYIEEYAFAYNTSISSLSMPDNVIQIGRYAFAYDYALYNISFNDTSKLPRISYAAFAYTGLQSFRVPANVSTMAQAAFIGCENLYSITFAANSKLDSISAYMFKNCENLQSITFESGSALTSIQAHGFEGMTKLVSVDFGDAKLTNIDNYAFRYCESLQTVAIPEGVDHIGRYAFYGCKSLTRLDMPETIEYIGSNAFYGAENLNIYFASETLPEFLQENWDNGIGGYYVGVQNVVESGDWQYATLKSGQISIVKYNGTETNVDLTAVDLGGEIASIGGYAFYRSDVETITLPQSLTSIQPYAFANSKLTSVSIPQSVYFIGKYAFFSTPITSVTFEGNSGLQVMEQYAFASTKSLVSISLPASLSTMGSYAFYKSAISSVQFAENSSLTSIPKHAFASTGLTEVTLPDSVIYIDDNAFRDSLQLQTVNFGAGENLQVMSNAFYNTGITTLTIPENMQYIGEYAFVGLEALTEFVVDENNPYYAAYDGMLYEKSMRKLIAVPAARTGVINLPESLEIIGYGAFENSKAEEVNFHENSNILALGYRAFYGAKNLKSVHIPASVVTIDFYAFATCDNLTTVTFAEGSKLTGVYEGAFYGCKNLRNITLPDSIMEISDFAFYGCLSLKALPLSATTRLKGIYDYAFAYSGLTELTIPDTVIDIGSYAFLGARLTSVTIPDANKEQLVIGIGAFEDCHNLQEITLPFIGATYEDMEITWFGYIFGAGGYEANNTYVPASLKTVTITEGITFVGTGGFYSLTNIEKVNIPHSVTEIYQSSFGETSFAYELTNTIAPYYVDYYGDIVNSTTINSNYIGKGISGHLELAEGVTSIDYAAFV